MDMGAILLVNEVLSGKIFLKFLNENILENL